MKFKSVTWFNPGATEKIVGIISGTDEVTDKPLAYIGVVDGLNEKEDIVYIAEWGAKLYPHMLRDILEFLESDS